ncbi:MAG: hypothetical protein H0U95_01410 [Bacteroidetes bacterium]|nr:hypothetical protein [Bacteroidota bacterium]
MKDYLSIKLILFSCLIFNTLFSFGQGIITDKDNEFDKKYTPAQNSLFNELNPKNKTSNSYTSVEIKNSIKFCPTQIFRQKVTFFYEVQINRGLSFNFGLGKAFGVDVFEQFFFDGLSDQYEPNVLLPGDLLMNSRYNGSSPIVSTGMRIYYSGKAFDGGFVDLNYRYSRMDYILKPEVSGRRIEGSQSMSFKMNSFSFGFGHTFVTGHKNNITHEIFMNLGIKLFKYPKYDQVESMYETYYRRSSAELNGRILPSFNMGYVFGFGF